MAAEKSKLPQIPKINGPKGFKFKFKINLRTVLLALLILFFVGPLLFSFGDISPKEEVALSQVLVDIREGRVEKVLVSEEKVSVTYKDGSEKVAFKEKSEGFTQVLKNAQIDPTSFTLKVEDQRFSKVWIDVLGIFLPLALMGLFFLFIFRQARGAQDSIFSFGKSRVKAFAKGKQSITFADVAGVDDAKKELEEIVDFLKNPKKYSAIGARTPKGVLLFGPAGVGKTLLARAVAGQAGVPFFSMAGSEFMEMLVGVGASRVRDLFATAKKASPSIIFIDEVDAIGRQRGGMGMSGGHDEREQTLNQILVEMDGFTPNDNVVIIAATNRGDLLDPALLRPGRFDRRVVLDMPDKEARAAILRVHAKGKKFGHGIDWDRVSSMTVGFSGADLENMLNEAAILAARENKKEIVMSDIEEAVTKVQLGPAKKKLQTDEDRKITAYHEAGHAIVTHSLPKLDPVQRVSIVARGLSLGHTLVSPVIESSHQTKSRLLEQITAMLGGRAAEEVVFGDFTAGAANDIEAGTNIARRMVVDFGMSSLGPTDWGPQYDTDMFGRMRYWEPSQTGVSMQDKIDSEIKRIIEDCYKKALLIVKKNKKKLDSVSAALMKVETLEQGAFEKIVGSKSKINF